jgi:hypothetical protein
MCSLKTLLNLTTGLIQCFYFKKAIYPSYLRAAPPWQQPHTSISFQKVLKERRVENHVYKKAGMGTHPQEIQANKRTKTLGNPVKNITINQDITNTQIK